MHNYIEDIKGKVRVYCRIRPLLQNELDKNHKIVVKKDDELTLQVDSKQGLKNYNFDAIFDQKNSQVSLMNIFLIIKKKRRKYLRILKSLFSQL